MISTYSWLSPSPPLISIYFNGLYNGEGLSAGGGPILHVESSSHFILPRQGLDSFSKPFSLISNPSLLIIAKHTLISQIKKGRKKPLVFTCPSCFTPLLLPLTVKGLKTIVYTMLSLLQLQFPLQIFHQTLPLPSTATIFI